MRVHAKGCGFMERSMQRCMMVLGAACSMGCFHHIHVPQET